MTESNDVLIDIEDLHKVFVTEEVETHALGGIEMEIKKGEFVSIAGPSGCGKTTVAKMVLGLEKMTGGDIYISGKPMSSISLKDIARRVQPVFQDPYSSLNPRKSIARIISLPIRALGLTESRAKWEARVDEIMEVDRWYRARISVYL